MKIKAYESEEGLVASLDGEIDHHAAREARDALDALIAEARPKVFCLDLAGVAFMDSSGLGLVLGRYRRVSLLGGKMMLRDPSERTEKLLKLAGVDKMMRIERTEQNENGRRKA